MDDPNRGEGPWHQPEGPNHIPQTTRFSLLNEPNRGPSPNQVPDTSPLHTLDSSSFATRQQASFPDSIKDGPEDERSVQNDSYTRAADINPSHTMTVAHVRRNANGTVGSVYSGNKIRHLKKEDGIPLWRKDIQFSFLRAVFEDQTPAFTNIEDGSKGHSFASIYIKAMARSNKTSRILRDKLHTDMEAATNMAMVCLLVNVGRMNTTLNFFPEMRAQLRTYHSIPCLQANQDPGAYKQLQDAPRLKSILKGACEDLDLVNTVEKIKRLHVPRTNPVHLVFVLSQYAPKISELHFVSPRDFFDLIVRPTLSSKSRAKAFLWLIWWYLESDFSKAAAENNPFGPGQYGESGEDTPIKVPAFEHLTEEQALAENVDTQEEIDFGEMKRLERKRILEEDETVGPPMKKPMKALAPGDHIMDEVNSSPARPPVSESERSPSPILGSDVKPLWMPKPPAPRGHEIEQPMPRVILKTQSETNHYSSSPVPPGAGHPILHATPPAVPHSRRARPETSHQKAVNNNRKARVENLLHKKLTREQDQLRRANRTKSVTFGHRAMQRIAALPAGYDTEDEDSFGPGGLVPGPDEEDDFGGEATKRKKVVDRAMRRLYRGQEDAPDSQSYALESLGHAFAKQAAQEATHAPVRRRQNGRGGRQANGGTRGRKPRASAVKAQPEGLDELDMELLGEAQDEGDVEME